jgi:pyruvate kinase
MLSAETAIGEHPIEAVETAGRIATTAEAALHPGETALPPDALGADVQIAMSAAVAGLAEQLDLSAIVTLTESGATARAVARHRPPVPLVAVTPHEHVARRLGLVWGVIPVVLDFANRSEATVRTEACEAARAAGVCQTDCLVAVTSGRASRVPGATDTIVVARI